MIRTLSIACVAVALTGLQAQAQGAGTLTKTSQGFRWERGRNRFELTDRGRKWTQGEAQKLKYGFDRLPDVLLDYARELKCTTWYRDAKPKAVLGIEHDVLATTVVVSGFIACGDKLLARPAPSVYYTVAHELGHVAQFGLTGLSRIPAHYAVVLRGTSGFTGISWTLALTKGLKSYNGFVSDYARTNDREDFAESAEFYWINPDELERVSPAKFRFMRDRVFQGKSSPPASRDLNHKAIAPVRPRIAELGDDRDGQRSLVTIKGTRFMGPRDGGFNRVEYRGQKALHLAVSRSTVYSWVPKLSLGSAPITVTTQDGTSNAKPFEVIKEPWWKFW